MGEQTKSAGQALREGGATDEISEAARKLGKIMTPRKEASNARNAVLGGRPEGQRNSEESRQRMADAQRRRREREQAAKNGGKAPSTDTERSVESKA